MGSIWKDEISGTILNIFLSYKRIDVLKLLFLEELYGKTFVAPYVLNVILLYLELYLIFVYI